MQNVYTYTPWCLYIDVYSVSYGVSRRDSGFVRRSVKFYGSCSERTCLSSLHDKAICEGIQDFFFFQDFKQLQIAAKLFSRGNSEKAQGRGGRRALTEQ